jgi:SAM-dependent methyltransferase
VENDPTKKFIQYPEALRLLGDIENQKVLDVGCGTGVFTRMLAEQGAMVVGYDPSSKQIEEAQRKELQKKQNIEYFVGDRPPILSEHTFNQVVSVLVLPYATDKENLSDIFTYAHGALIEKGSFSSIIYNPNFKRLGEIVYNRRFVKTDDNKIQVDFLDEKGVAKVSAKFSNFSLVDYENAAANAGFTNIEWFTLEVNQTAREAQNEDFWKDFEKDPPYIGIKVLEKRKKTCPI